jgi:two-component system, sensor histidine kinase and response regulator
LRFCLGSGTTFHFILAFKVPRGKNQTSHQVESKIGDDYYDHHKKSGTLLSGVKILLVDDNDMNLELFYEILSEQGSNVTVAENGQEALDRLNELSFDLVLMDCQMPIMDGYVATGKIRAQERLKNLPIIALTANTMRGDKEKCLAAGMSDFIGKPIEENSFYKTILEYSK